MASSKEDFGFRRQQRHAFKHMPSSMPRQMMISWMVMGRVPSPETKDKKKGDGNYNSGGYGNKNDDDYYCVPL